MDPTHALVPLDGSPLADKALVHALETFDCRVTVLSVVTPIDASMSEGGVLEPGENRRSAAHKRAQTLVEEAKSRAEGMGHGADTAVEMGDPADSIVAFATEHDVDHIVMGGHGDDRYGLARRLLGTVATDVVAEAPMTVTVVR